MYYGNQIIPLLITKTRQSDTYYQDVKASKVFNSFTPKVGIPKKENNLVADLYNLTLGKTAQSLVLSGIQYAPSQTPTLGNIIYDPVTIKVQIQKEGVPVSNNRVYLLDMNMLCVAQTVSDSDGFAYFFNKPSTYLYHVIAEDVKGQYVSTVVSKLSGS